MRAALVALALCACGGPDGGFAGMWRGTSTFEFVGGSAATYSSSISIQTVGGDLSVSGVCPTVAASIEAPVNGTHAAWAGSISCGTFATSTCSVVELTLTTGDLVLSGATLTATGTGNATGCGQTNEYVNTFVGTK